MKTPKIKRYQLSVSRTFPKGHPMDGQPTCFTLKILSALGKLRESSIDPKLHTIRSNYPLWEKRMKKVQAGESVIELFYWEGKPYKSQKIVFATLDKDSGCGVQKVYVKHVDDEGLICSFSFDGSTDCCHAGINHIALNDGLSPKDFQLWFKSYDLSKTMVIIQFTSFRY